MKKKRIEMFVAQAKSRLGLHVIARMLEWFGRDPDWLKVIRLDALSRENPSDVQCSTSMNSFIDISDFEFSEICFVVKHREYEWFKVMEKIILGKKSSVKFIHCMDSA